MYAFVSSGQSAVQETAVLDLSAAIFMVAGERTGKRFPKYLESTDKGPSDNSVGAL